MWIELLVEGYVWIGDCWYWGCIYIIFYKGGIIVINYVNIEEYIYSVIGVEMSSNWL